MVVINKYLHQYDFPVFSHLGKYIPELVNFYFDNIKNNKGSANVEVENIKINEFLIPHYLKILNNNYQVGKTLGKIQSPAIYLQSSKDTIPEFHTHIDSSILTFVFYLCLPDEGGGIEFNLPPKYSCKIQPQFDKLYVFPSYITHRPLGQISKDLRISINWGYNANSRIVHKKSNMLW